MNYAQTQRLRCIDFCLDRYGYINRSHIEDFYGVSAQQASADLGDYDRITEGKNMGYDKQAKRYRKTDRFVRKFP